MAMDHANARRPKSDPSSASTSRSESMDSKSSSGSQDVDPQRRRVLFLEDVVGQFALELDQLDAMDAQSVMHWAVEPNLGIWTPGAAAHAEGQCIPCKHLSTGGSCAAGASCDYCHLKHASGHPRLKFRPCRGKRTRFRKMIEKMRETVLEGGAIDLDELDFVLPSIKSNEYLKLKVMKRLMAEGLVPREDTDDPGAAGADGAACPPAPAPRAGGPPGTWLPGPSGPSIPGASVGAASARKEAEAVGLVASSVDTTSDNDTFSI